MKETTKYQNEIKDKIIAVWKILDKCLNEDKIRFSSENTFMFNFALQLFKEYPKSVEKFDFEVQLFQDFSDGKFLDLFILKTIIR